MSSVSPEPRRHTTTDIINAGFIAIIRCEQQSEVAAIVDNLAEAGVLYVEITSNTPGWQHEIKQARLRHPELCIGAGTIKNTELVSQAADAGAQFIVTPNTNKAVVDAANKYQLTVLMGAFTPTEVADAIEYGADIVKLFPSEILGIKYFQSLLGPFNDTHIMAVDNMSVERAQQWLEAGASGVAVGNILAYPCSSESEKEAQRMLAQRYMAVCQK
ncbi:bifunctional 4-hydroxy-2-oxoglutarate aldolase/2-dehydro-3-deoxy-phosphogluconate aldolase [Agaribacterium sp. ZY112]|uniref:bifunctional 4-hydroxy-2-oxoglutarate aldolase/2-dehydro-3-deoxy-phosphogluconate aldolase n=1 Tax=Agaribacterium sp. ZY112 TaxID=3233574 RepID=UPI0035236FEE